MLTHPRGSSTIFAVVKDSSTHRKDVSVCISTFCMKFMISKTWQPLLSCAYLWPRLLYFECLNPPQTMMISARLLHSFPILFQATRLPGVCSLLYGVPGDEHCRAVAPQDSRHLIAYAAQSIEESQTPQLRCVLLE